MFPLGHTTVSSTPYEVANARHSDARLRLSQVPLTADDWILDIANTRSKSAFESLFRHYAPRLKSFVISMGASAGIADEVVQEAMLSVWRRSSQFDPTRGSGGAWLFSIARNTFISHVRQQKRHETSDVDTAFVSSAPDPEQMTTATEFRDKLTVAIASLPTEQATVLHRAFMLGLPLQQVAIDENIPLGTVKTRARLALEKLRIVFKARDLS
jgi:RNA polymerase sigma factor (sigma-70 family)